MNNHKQSLGKYGERLAADYLQQQGYRILDTNWHCKHGEIDIVAKFTNFLVFVEVKTRRSASTESGFASITPAKQQRLISAVHEYMANYHIDEASQWRIDAIAIALPKTGNPIIDHVEDALGW